MPESDAKSARGTPAAPTPAHTKGEWIARVTAKDIATVKTQRWMRRNIPITDWENQLGDALGTKFVPPPSSVPPFGFPSLTSSPSLSVSPHDPSLSNPRHPTSVPITTSPAMITSHATYPLSRVDVLL
ncbi:hypothetical protein DL93DRAFT_2082568 [Clavulina sp. PMI_390]|nr:hypothetical protein DL93DRAFT_2082568 [Clavulina sp. PMI_390]